MIHYTASELVKRAFNLADLGNTDFITYEECNQYLNDAWNEVYNYIINHNDAQFIREVTLNGDGIYQLPCDLYKIHSVKSSNNSIINRATVSSVSGYSVVNDTLRVNNGPSRLTLSYWVEPLTLTYPDIAHELSRNDIISTAKNSALLEDGTIINLLSGEQIGAVTLDDECQYYLGNGHIIEVSYDEQSDPKHCYTYYSFNGKQLAQYEMYTTDGNYIVTYDSNWNLYLVSKSGTAHSLFGTEQIEQSDIIGALKVGDEWITVTSTAMVWNNHEYSKADNLYPAKDYDNCKSFYGIMDNQLYRFFIREDGTLMAEILEKKDPIFVAWTEYGPILSNGTYFSLYSGIPDTEMNFPNELYFSLISANLAMRFLTKQNADSSGMNTIYENMMNTFRNSLGQDGQYSVIQNAYY